MNQHQRRHGPLAEAESIETVRAAYDAFARGDAEGFVALFADEGEILEWDGLPWGGHACGRDEVRRFVERAGSQIRSRASAEELFVAGEDIVAIGRSVGTILATEQPFDIRIVHRWRVRDRRIVLWHLLVEAPPLLTALVARSSDDDGASV